MFLSSCERLKPPPKHTKQPRVGEPIIGGASAGFCRIALDGVADTAAPGAAGMMGGEALSGVGPGSRHRSSFALHQRHMRLTQGKKIWPNREKIVVTNGSFARLASNAPSLVCG